MICNHCGKEYSDDFAYCPYCAEPKPKAQTEKQELKQYKDGVLSKFIFKLIICFAFSCLMFAYLLWAEGIGIAVFLSIVTFCGLSLIPFFEYYAHTRPGRLRTINIQFTKDQTSICPSCGSHNIKLYRKGYDYKVGFWGAIFGVRGAGYAGGFDANKTCCRCMNCGKDWETDYDYRLINK